MHTISHIIRRIPYKLSHKSEIMHPFFLQIGSLIIETSILGETFC